jgi:EpsI family protein
MVARILIVLVLVGSAGLYARSLAARRSYSDRLPALQDLPRHVGEWQSEDLPLSEDVSEILAAETTLYRRYYRIDGSEVWLFLAYFAEQRVNSQIHSPRHCVPGGGWRIESLDALTVALPGGTCPTTRMVIGRDDQKVEMLYWFRTRGGVVTGEYRLKWDLLKNSLAGRPTDAVFVRFTAPIMDSEAMRRLVAELDAPLSRVLGEVGLQ